MDKIKNLSVRKTIILYMSVSLVCSFFLSAVIVRKAYDIQEKIWWNYVDQEKYFEAVAGEREEAPYYTTDVPRPSAVEMSGSDHALSEICDFLQTYTVLILSIAGSCVSVILFYRHKLKRPLEALEQASGRIARNDLDFQITYENQDEMGRLCQEFERMRGQLAQNNQKLWRTIEDERALRAAISHDIRSPLSVLKGYQEMLLEFLPDGTIDIPKAVEMLTEGMKQLERMDRFVEAMRKMSSLEQRKLQADRITSDELEKDMRAEVAVLGMEKGKQVVLNVPETEESFCGDKEIILEVAENLLSNALRYARWQVEVMICVTGEKLKLCVKDDGHGFQEETEKITEAFYQQNIKDSLKHAGLGMYISRLYCEKHGGSLLLENGKAGGAVVTAIFCRIA